MRVALLVTNPYRDLPGQVLTAMYLCREGVTCYLVPSQLRRREIWPLAPDLVVLDNLRTGNEHLTARMLGTGMRIVVADSEGGVFTTLERYAAKLARDPAVRHAVGRYCAWGPRLASQAISDGWFTAQQVRVTGTPRFDFYVEPWRSAALRLSPYAERFGPPLVLINGNFNRANPWFGTPERAIHEYFVDGYDEDGMRRWLEVERGARRDLVALARRLAAALPGVTFVYRPHPFEKPEAYDGQLDGYPNLHLVKQGTIEGWILRASAILHRGSSTAIEATLAGRPAFSPDWIPAPVSYPAVDAVSIHCASEEELRDGLDRALRGEAGILDPVRDSLRDVLAQWFAEVDGAAHRRVGDAVLECLREGGGRVSLDRCRDALEHLDSPQAGWRDRARAHLRRALRLSPHWSFRQWREVADLSWDQSARYFGVREVQGIVDALQPAAGLAVRVDSAQQAGDFHFRYQHGRAVRLRPDRAPHRPSGSER